jgi:hypothetical protein
MILRFTPCEAVERGKACKNGFLYQRRDPLGYMRNVCEYHAYQSELCFPIKEPAQLPEIWASGNSTIPKRPIAYPPPMRATTFPSFRKRRVR